MTSPRRPRITRYRTVVPARPAISRWRVAVVAAVMVMVTSLFGWRLIDLQLTPDAALAGDIGSQIRGESQEAPRGDITDRLGRPIAQSLPRPSIVANPRLIPASEVDSIVASLAPLLSTDPAVIEERLRRDKAFVYLERQVDQEIGDAIAILELPGVQIYDEQRREHPNGDCSALAVVGRVDVDQFGISGMEEAYDESLTGTAGLVVSQTQRGGEVLIPGGQQVVSPVRPGEELQLTIDRNIQFQTEQTLIQALEDTGGAKAIAILADPMTGEIFAMASVVRDDVTGEIGCTTTNLATTWTYEPGSIMKPLTFAGVFEHDAWGEAVPIDIPAVIEIQREEGVASHKYRDINLQADEAHTPSWILQKSSNNGTIMLATELGPDRLYATFLDFGLGSRTALDSKGEASGILDPLDTHSLLLSNAAIGQSVAVTPIQMLQAYNALAAGGSMIEPVLVLDEVGAATARRVVSEQTADTVLRMMRGVVTDGTGKRGAVPGYVVAGKTGTAWQPCSAEFGYWCEDQISRHYTASFIGIVENDRGPVLSALVIIDDPEGPNVHGGTIAAPVFADLVSYALPQLRIPAITNGSSSGERVRAESAVAVVEPPADAEGEQ